MNIPKTVLVDRFYSTVVDPGHQFFSHFCPIYLNVTKLSNYFRTWAYNNNGSSVIMLTFYITYNTYNNSNEVNMGGGGKYKIVWC